MRYTFHGHASSLARAGLAVALLFAAPTPALAQSHDAKDMSKDKPAERTPRQAMASQRPLGISMERMGSGTTWIPDAVTLPSRHLMVGTWNIMVHGYAFAQFDAQGGTRGATQWGSLNWGMVMAEHAMGGGQVQFRFMPSLDAATVGCGYPLLLQSGESCKGKALVDTQHPHDLFMELGVLYERAISAKVGAMFYAAPAGEPALGPVAFMHRPSAMDEPQAPIGHHWQDATHISFGVVTAGLFTRTIRLEASTFNGHEPDDHRWGFDPIALNSYSARLTVNPNAHWSLTSGWGRIDDPERSRAAKSMTRVAASAMYGRELGTAGQVTGTVVYGQNSSTGHARSFSMLAESEAVLNARHTILGRAEFVQKSAAELQVSDMSGTRVFNVTALSLGYVRELTRGHRVTLGVGARGSVNVVPAALQSSYGSRTPLGGMVFVRLRPVRSTAHDDMDMHAGMEHEHHEP